MVEWQANQYSAHAWSFRHAPHQSISVQLYVLYTDGIFRHISLRCNTYSSAPPSQSLGTPAAPYSRQRQSVRLTSSIHVERASKGCQTNTLKTILNVSCALQYIPNTIWLNPSDCLNCNTMLQKEHSSCAEMLSRSFGHYSYTSMKFPISLIQHCHFTILLKSFLLLGPIRMTDRYPRIQIVLYSFVVSE